MLQQVDFYRAKLFLGSSKKQNKSDEPESFASSLLLPMLPT